MARPNKQTVDYFPHDTDASEGKTMTIIQAKYGNDGYAFWFKLLQLLGKSPGHYFDFNNPADWEFLLAKTNQKDTETTLQILGTLVLLGAIDKELYENCIIWCQKFVDGVAHAYSRAEKGVPQRPDFLVNVVNNVVFVNNNGKKPTETPYTKRILKDTILKDTKETIIFNHWNSKNIIVHRTLTDSAKQAINARSKDFTVEEIITSIDNYATILFGQEYGLMTYYWTLKEFLSGERVEKFLDLERAKANYLKDKKGGSNGVNRRNPKELPKQYTRVEDL